MGLIGSHEPFVSVKKKIQPSKIEDLSGFKDSRISSILITKKSFLRVAEGKEKREQGKEIISKRKERF